MQANRDVRWHRSTLIAWFEMNKDVSESGSDELGILATASGTVPRRHGRHVVVLLPAR